MQSIIASIGFAILFMSGVSAQTGQVKPTPCEPGSTSKKGMAGEKGTSGYERPANQPQEKSAILPAAPQNEQSAAPTVQQNGRAVEGETTCERTPNEPR